MSADRVVVSNCVILVLASWAPVDGSFGSTTLASNSTTPPPANRQVDPAEQAFKAEIAELRRQLSQVGAESDLRFRAIQLDIRELRTTVYTFIGILVAAGIGSAVSLVKWARGKMKGQIEKAIYGVDPTCKVVHFPATGLERELARLKWLGFKVIRPYSGLNDACLTGLLVFHGRSIEDIEELRAFIRSKSFRKDLVGIVIYTTLTVPSDIVAEFENITFANTPPTLGHQLFVIARGLHG